MPPRSPAATGRRIDFKLDEECLLKVSFDDPEKGMTALSLLPEIAQSAGVGFADLVERILGTAALKIKRQED